MGIIEMKIIKVIRHITNKDKWLWLKDDQWRIPCVLLQNNKELEG